MKYFLFSDVHGEYDALVSSLQEAAFDLSNPDHMLIGVGDYFDRGPQNEFVLAFIMSMKEQGRIKLIRGNHDDMLFNFLAGNSRNFQNDIIYNGLDKTILQLSGQRPTSSMHIIIAASHLLREEILKKYPGLIDFIKDMKDVIQIDNNIITHGGFSKSIVKESEAFPDNWANTPVMILKDFLDKQYTYIFGHWHAEKLNEKFNISTGSPHIFIYKNYIGIDGKTNITKKVTIYTIETDTNIMG